MRPAALITRFIAVVGELFQWAAARMLVPVISAQAPAAARPVTARCGMER